MHYDDREREEPCEDQAAQDRELAGQIKWLAMSYAAAVSDTALAGIHIDWPEHTQRSKHAARAVAQAFLCDPIGYSAADAQNDWAKAMMVWCLEHNEIAPGDAVLTYAEMPLLSQLAEMNGIRAMRAVMR